MNGYNPSVTSAFEGFGRSADDDTTRLVVIAGPIAGATYPLTEVDTSIGRRPENTICVPSQNFSKTHCRIVRESDHHVIIDEGSTNGTFVNGRRLEAGTRLQLTSGDTVRIAEVTFLFYAGRAAGAAVGLDDIHVDLGSAMKEADDILGGFPEAIQVARQRRQRASS